MSIAHTGPRDGQALILSDSTAVLSSWGGLPVAHTESGRLVGGSSRIPRGLSAAQKSPRSLVSSAEGTPGGLSATQKSPRNLVSSAEGTPGGLLAAQTGLPVGLRTILSDSTTVLSILSAGQQGRTEPREACQQRRRIPDVVSAAQRGPQQACQQRRQGPGMARH